MEKTEKYTEISETAPKGWGTRHTIAMLCFLGSAVSYAIRFNLSLAIVDMVNRTQPVNSSSHFHHHPISVTNLTSMSGFTYAIPCPNLIEPPSDHSLKLELQLKSDYEQTPLTSSGEFHWNEAEQGVILGSFFWGYIFTQIPGGMLAKRFGGKWPYGIGLLIAGIFTFITPWAARADMKYLIIARVMEGLASGVHISAQTTLISQWAPPKERSMFSTIAFGGTFMGTAGTMIASGYLIHENILGGWPSVFYAVGLFSIFWFVIWSIVVSNSPAEHRWISREEREYIEKSLGDRKSRNEGEHIHTPWKQVVTCVPMWATFFGHIAHAWGIYTLLTELPTYMKTVLHFNIKKNSYLSAVPYLMSWVMGIGYAQIADVLLRRNKVRIVTVRKTAQMLAHGGGALALIGVAFSGCNQIVTVGFLILSVGLSGIANSGFIVTYVDLAPNHAGLIIGAANTMANLCGVGAPFVAGLLINNNPSVENWKFVFLISAAILLVGAVIFVAFASATEQPWNNFHQLTTEEDGYPEEIEDDENDTPSGSQTPSSSSSSMRDETEKTIPRGLNKSLNQNIYGDDDDDDINEYENEEHVIKTPLKGSFGNVNGHVTKPTLKTIEH